MCVCVFGFPLVVLLKMATVCVNQAIGCERKYCKTKNEKIHNTQNNCKYVMAHFMYFEDNYLKLHLVDHI